MVSNLSIFFMSISLIICLAFPIGGIIYLKVKYKVSLKTFFIGMLAFFIAVQILEAPIHNYILNINKGTAEFLLGNPVAYMLYGGLMAGIFEETARLISFKYLIKDRNDITAITYGVGHGGIEAILIGGISSLNAIVYSIFINNGTFQSVMEGALASEEVISATYNQFVNSSSFFWLMAGVERITAMLIHISLSIIVFYAVKERKYIYYFIAIICHAVINFPAALYQLGVITNIYIIELVIFLLAIGLAFIAFKKLIKKVDEIDEIV
ncbi:YhfC family glutamic-type intramembrane protease [Clostridium sp. AL.422]|uniref:YhfC family intramembrane metalloprotease n=1 Tax=Clostridium TaxID=1485 RepID=UPI00293DC9ED|nr:MULTISPECIES: YhfC family glutamic-type intramembrane protease [unclassified Clostridium]MDV4149823.1 YhfC family glutamic-type intramembrane protease [Clostridium sp. AL.422]